MSNNNILICGDNIETLKELDNNSVDLVVTSPPYFNAKEYSQYDTLESYMDIMKKTFELVENILKESRMCIINISPVIVKREKRSEQSYRIPLPYYFVPMMEDIGFEFLEDIIWEKPESSVPNRNGGFFRHRKPIAYKPNIVTEYILIFKKKSNFLIDKILQNNSLVEDDYERSNIWKIHPKTKSKHPAPFPDELAKKCILYYSYKGDVILDPFVGSGTTCKVAKDLGRKYIGIDVSQKYIDIAKDRLNE